MRAPQKNSRKLEDIPCELSVRIRHEGVPLEDLLSTIRAIESTVGVRAVHPTTVKRWG